MVWIQGRTSWMLATLYNTVEEKKEWLEWSKSGIRFLREHGVDSDGWSFFTLPMMATHSETEIFFFRDICRDSFGLVGQCYQDSSLEE
ncbi:MAG TPA: hypothetical protein VFW11_05950 [Cyclobacteriaceae bacterium]|nr:hypothetical protein [Cyclobacteriaceae bacterium]